MELVVIISSTLFWFKKHVTLCCFGNIFFLSRADIVCDRNETKPVNRSEKSWDSESGGRVSESCLPTQMVDVNCCGRECLPDIPWSLLLNVGSVHFLKTYCTCRII